MGGQNSLGTTAPFGVPSSSFQALSGAGATAGASGAAQSVAGAAGAVSGGQGILGQAKKDDSWKDGQVRITLDLI